MSRRWLRLRNRLRQTRDHTKRRLPMKPLGVASHVVSHRRVTSHFVAFVTGVLSRRVAPP
jgi:hypothetical protein